MTALTDLQIEALESLHELHPTTLWDLTVGLADGADAAMAITLLGLERDGFVRMQSVGGVLGFCRTFHGTDKLEGK